MLNGFPSDDDHAERVAQRTRGDAEAIQGDVVTIFYIAFLKFVAADKEPSVPPGGEFSRPRVAPLVLLLAFDFGPFSSYSFFESIS